MDENELGSDTTVYAFGSPCDTFYGRLVFRSDGTIIGYSNPSEKKWTLDAGVLTFFNDFGEPTSHFTRDGASRCWLGTPTKTVWPLVLVPIVRNEPNVSMACRYPPVFVNSVPKSGTYYIESVFKELGWRPTRLHLGTGGSVDDFRGVPDALVHTMPQNQRIYCPSDLIAATLQRGDLIVGHVHSIDEVNAIRSNGVLDISLVRNLKDTLISLYNFKIQKVEPTDIADTLWRSLDEKSRFLAFLIHYYDRDIADIRATALSFIEDRNSRLVRYEDMVEGIVKENLQCWLNDIESELSARFASALQAKLHTPNPTFSGKAADRRAVWNEGAQAFFAQSGLQDLNVSLGYE